MSWVNKQVAKFFPGYALKREVARRRLDRLEKLKPGSGDKRGFGALSKSRLRYDFVTTSKSADSAIHDGIEGLRQNVRQLEYDNGFIAGPIQRIVNYVVGRGFSLQATVKADDVVYDFPKINESDAEKINTLSERAFKKWSARSDVRLLHTFPEQCRLAEAALLRDGEILAVGRESKRKDRIIPYCLELLEADRLVTPAEETGNARVRNGIRYDNEGVPEAYYVLKRHPGETITLARGADFEEVPAYNKNGTKKMLHLFNPLRPEQSRGFSAFAAGLKNFQDLDRYHEAEIYAALEAACLTGIVTTEDPVGFNTNFTEPSNNENYDRIHDFAPGMWHYTKPGEKVDIFNPARPNDQFGEMTNQLLRGPANALNIPPEVLSQDWQGMNYSNARTVLLMFYLTCWVRQSYLMTHLCDPVYENVMINMVIRGTVKAIGFDRRKDDYLSHTWIPRVKREWVDPQKEANGKETDLRNGIETLPDIWMGKGEDWEEKLELQAKALKKIRALEEKYDIKFPVSRETEGTVTEDKENEADRNLRAVK